MTSDEEIALLKKRVDILEEALRNVVLATKNVAEGLKLINERISAARRKS